MSNNNFRVDELYDKDGVKKDISLVEDMALQSVRKLVAEINKEFQGVKIALPDLKDSKTLLELTENSKKAAAAVESLNKANNAFQREIERAAKENEKRLVAIARQDEKEAKDKVKRHKEAQAAIRKETDAYIKSVKDGQKELDKLAREQEKIAQQAARRAANQKEKEAKQAEAQAARELREQLKQLDNERKILEAQTRKEQKEVERLQSAYTRLSDAHIKAKQIAKDAGAEFGVESAIFKTAAANANLLGDKLKAIDGNLGVHSRNVGNYGSQWNGLSYSIGNIISEIPNFAQSAEIGLRSMGNNIVPVYQNLKQLNEENKVTIANGGKAKNAWQLVSGAIFNVQTAIILATTALILYGSKAFAATGAVEKAEKANKKYAESIKSIEESSRSSANEEIARLKVLEKVATDTTKSTKSRKMAADEMQRLYPEYLKNIKDEAILQGQAAEKINEVTGALLQKASATAAEKKFAAASEQVYDLTLAQRDAYQELLVAQAKLNSTTAGKPGEEKGLNQFFDITKVGDAKKALADVTAQLKKATDEQARYLKDAQDMGAKSFDLFKPKKEAAGPKATDLTNTEISNLKRINKAKADMRMDDLEEIAQSAKSTYEYEKQAYEQRIEALNTYYSAQAAINEINKERELKDIQDNLNEIARIKNTPEGNRTPAQKQLLTQLEAFETEKQAIEKRYEKLSRKAERDKQLESISIAKTYMDEKERVLLEGHMAEMNQLNTATNTELEALNNRYAQGIISEREYRAELEKIQNESLKSTLQEEINYTKNLIKLKKARGEDTSALEKSLSEISLQFTEATNKKAIGAASKQTEELKKIQQQLYDFTNRLIDLAADNKIKKLDEQQEALEYNSEREQRQHELDYKNELSRISATTLTEEDRAEAIAKAEETKNARITASQNQLQANSAAIDEMKKQIQKRAALGQAAIDTALAIGKITAEALVLLANPLTAAAAPFAFAQIPLAVANGAITLATINAAYKDGTPIGGHPGGPALVGDGYEHELVLEKSGKAWVTPNTPTLLPSLSAGAHVIPFSNTELIKMAGLAPLIHAEMSPGSSGISKEEMQSMFNSLYHGLQSESQEHRRQDRTLHSSLVRTLRQKAIDPLKLRGKVNRIND